MPFSTRLARVCRAVIVAAALLGQIVLPAPALAAGGVTGNLRGSVVDAASGSPLAGVTVVAVSASGRFQTTTDASGYYSLLQIPTDTYTLGFSKPGYDTFSLTGVTILGDQTQNAGPVRLSTLKTLAHVSARSPSSAFQPHQTVDETTFSGARVDQALGETGSTDYNKLVESAPGVIQTAQGSNAAISIRGSASVEIGYQFDGIDFRGAFFDENPNNGFLNGIGGGRGSLQVVSGAGDATQGGIGAGVVNLVPGRGSYPGTGFVSFDVGSPWYDHALAFQYGIATPNGRISDFLSVRADRSAPQIAPYGRDAADAGAYFGTSFTYDDDVLNNFIYRFGRNNDQQFQVLTDFLDHRSWTEYGGLAAAAWYPWNPLNYGFAETDGNGSPMWGCIYQNQQPLAPGQTPPGCPFRNQLAWYDSILTYVQGVPHPSNPFAPAPPVLQPEQFNVGPMDVLKLGYTRQLNRNATWNTFFYNWGGLNESNITGNYSDLTDGGSGFFVNGYNPEGSRSTGVQSQLVVQASEKHILTLVGKFENNFPYWNQQNDGNTWQGLSTARGYDEQITGYNFQNPVVGYQPNGPRIEDWYLPLIPGQPVSASNPCIGPALDNNFNPTGATSMGCYLYDWLLSNGKWNGQLPAMPTAGWNYHNTDFQQFGVGLRDQWTPSSRWNIDYGIRLDGQNLKWGANPFSKDLANPYDVGVGFAQLPNTFLYPRLLEPRASANYLLGPNDSVRVSYGRSVSDFFGQYAGTPSALENINPIFFQIPAKDSATNPACGSGWHGPGTNGNGTYVANPNTYFSGQLIVNSPGYFFQCPNYASALYWNFDQGYSAPDVGGQQPSTYNNWDLTYQHQFKNQWGMKLTTYARRGFNTYQTVELNNGPPNPVTGQQTPGSFQERETGIQKALGMEFMLTTPDRAVGWSGFLTANYINELTNTPPVSGSDNLPIAQQFLYESGVLFHQSFLPPVSARAGITYATRSGWRINPILSFDGGEPFGVGRDAIGFINGVLYHIPTGNVGVATPYAGAGGPNLTQNATCYVDPAFAGNYFQPRDFACRGFSEPALAGQAFTSARLYSDLDLEYTRGRYTWGVYVNNLFDNYRGQPGVNPAWQPVATGVGGAQTGQFAGAFPVNLDGTPNLNWIAGGRDISRYDQYWLPFNEVYVPGINYRFYLRISL